MTAHQDIPRARDGTPLQLGNYRLIRPVSTGGMARVFEARREGVEGVSTRVAVKVILPDYAADPGFQELFKNEAHIGARLRHQNLVQIQDFNCHHDRYYLVMEFVEGLTLRRIIGLCRKHGVPVPLAVIAELGRQVCEGLHYLHTLRDEEGRPLGLVHRDVKPSNLIVEPQGVVKLLDFGVSVQLSRPDQESSVRGTWGYMAPEQAAAGRVGPGADCFGLATVLYELAALTPLFPESAPDELRKLLAADEAARRTLRLRDDPALAPLVPVLVRALQRDPDARYAGALELGRALGALAPDASARGQVSRFVEALSALEQPGPAAAREARPRKRRRQPEVEPDALPIAVLESRSASREAPEPAARGGGGLFLLLAVAIVGFTAWRVLAQPRGPLAAAPVPAVSAAVAPSLPSPERAPAPTPTSPPAAQPAPPSPAALPVAPVVGASAAEMPETPAALAAPDGPGLLTVSSVPRARVMLNDKFVKFTPLFQEELPPGPVSVTLIAEDGRSTRFQVDVPPGGEVSRVWDFDQGGWVDR